MRNTQLLSWLEIAHQTGAISKPVVSNGHIQCTLDYFLGQRHKPFSVWLFMNHNALFHLLTTLIQSGLYCSLLCASDPIRSSCVPQCSVTMKGGKCASFQSHHIYRTTKSMPRASSPSGQPHSLPWITSFQQFQDSLSPCSFHIVPFTLFLCLNSLPFHAQNRFFIRSKRTKAFFSSTQGAKGTSTIDSFSFQEASIST